MIKRCNEASFMHTKTLFSLWMLAILLVLALASIAYAQQCSVPENGVVLKSDTLVCAGQHSLPAGIFINANVVLDCQGATLLGSNINTGVTVLGDNVQIRNCRIQNYQVGLRAEGVSNFVEAGVSFAGNGQDRSISQGEDIELPQDNAFPAPTPPPQQSSGSTTRPNITIIAPPSPPKQPVVQKRNSSIWLVADIPSEQLIENALQYEFNSDNVPQAILNQRIAELQQTLKDVKIEREFIYTKDGTKVRIKIVPNNGFFKRVEYVNLTLYEYIPKCFAQLVDDIVFQGETPDVLEKDPLLRKVIKQGEPLEFAYMADMKVSDQCKSLFRVIGVGSGRKVSTFSSVLAEKGIMEVANVFPLESLTVVAFFCVLSVAGFAFKNFIDRTK